MPPARIPTAVAAAVPTLVPSAEPAAVPAAAVSVTAVVSHTPHPTKKPTPVPALPTVAATPALSGAAQQRVEQWLAHPIEMRARRAHDIAQWATKVIVAQPDSADARRLRSDLPGILKRETLVALEEHRPALARMFHNAYLSLDFAPADADLARRVNAMPVPTRPR